MLKWDGKRRYLVCALALAGLAACGGGGGGEDSAKAMDDNWNVADYPSPVDEAGSGLSAPSREFKGNDSAERYALFQNLMDAIPKIPGALAVQQLGKVAAGVGINGADGSYACPEGGEATRSGAGTALQGYSYSNCVSGGYTFNGEASATVNGAGTVLSIAFLGLDISASGTSVVDDAIGSAKCVLSGTTVGKCIAEYPTGSVEQKENFVWGWDTALTAGAANGTHQCGCEATWNVTYKNFGPTSGKAVIAGKNGNAYINRLDACRFTVKTVIDGVTSPAYAARLSSCS